MQQQMNSGGGMLGADPQKVNPEGMNELMEGVAMQQDQSQQNNQQQPNEEEQKQMMADQQQQQAQQQGVPPASPQQAQPFYSDQQQTMGVAPQPKYAEGGATPRQMQNMPDLDLINKRPGREDEQEEMPEMILAHVGGEELKELDKMQGGRRIDPETGLPIYDGLVPYIGTPEMMAIFKDMVYEVAETGELSEEKARFAAELDPIFPLTEGLPVDGPPSEHEEFPIPGEKELAEEGIDGDHELAIIPRALADMLDEIRGETVTNPKTGLPQYGFFKNIFKSIGKVAKVVGIGAAGLAALTFGGPLGLAGLGYGAKVYGDYKTNKRYAKDLRKAHEEHEAKNRALYDEEKKYQKGMVDEIEENMQAYRNAYKHQDISPYLDKILTKEEQGRGLGSDGLYQPSQQKNEYLYNPDDELINAPQQFKEGGAVHIEPLKETGIIEGPGKGQDDVIATSVPEKSYIIDASTVSDLGDGSSEAGAEVFDKFFENLRGRPSKTNHEAKEVPVYLSNDEYLIDEKDVTLLGGGDNSKGANLLKNIVKNIRKHKTSNGTGLPPKAKDLLGYFPKKG